MNYLQTKDEIGLGQCCRLFPPHEHASHPNELERDSASIHETKYMPTPEGQPTLGENQTVVSQCPDCPLARVYQEAITYSKGLREADE
jgi:hypothetical protein